MSARTMLPRLAAAATAMLATVAFPAPAHAADVDVSLRGLSSSMFAGGNSDGFSASVQNNGKEAYRFVQRTFVVQLDGLTTDGVLMARTSPPGFGAMQAESSGEGEVRFTDPLLLPLLPEGRRNEVTTQYRIQFTAGAPSGEATLTFEASGDGQNLGADQDSVNVRAPRGSEASPTNPVRTDPPVTGGPDRTPGALNPLDGEVAGASGGGIPWILYILGAVLAGAGGAILWLLFRGQRPALVDASNGGYPDGGYSERTYPGPQPGTGHQPVRPQYPQHDLQPTAALPTFGGSYAPLHGAQDARPTRERGGNPGRPRT